MNVPGTPMEIDLSRASRREKYLGGGLIVLGLVGIAYNLLAGSLSLLLVFVVNVFAGVWYIAYASDALPAPE